jgi:hypothetical protein
VVPDAIDPALLHPADYDVEDLYLEIPDAGYYEDYYVDNYGEEYYDLTGYGYEDE